MEFYLTNFVYWNFMIFVILLYKDLELFQLQRVHICRLLTEEMCERMKKIYICFPIHAYGEMGRVKKINNKMIFYTYNI